MDILNGINNDRFTLHIKNREYTEWEWLPSNEKCDINPLEAKLFHGDSIDINTRKTISSPLSEHMNICGGQTYLLISLRCIHKVLRTYLPHGTAYGLREDQ